MSAIIDYASSPEVFWSNALERIAEARLGLRDKEPADVWRQLEQLARAEQFARACLELAKEEAQKRQGAGLRIGNQQKANDSPLPPVGGLGHGPSAEIAAKAVRVNTEVGPEICDEDIPVELYIGSKD